MKQIKIIIAIAIFSVIGFTPVVAGDTSLSNPTFPVELKYAGTYKKQPLVQVNFAGSTEDKVYNILITDESGVVLYNEDVKGDVFSKQFLLNTDDLGDAILKFQISGKKSGKTVAYQVNRQKQQIIQQMDVVKL